MAEKTHRNLSMLEQERKEHPDKLYINYYLAALYFHTRNFKKAVHYAKLSVEKGERPNADAFAVYRVWYSSLGELKDVKGQRRVLQQGIKDFPTMPDFYLELGDRLAQEKKYAKALEYLEKGEACERDFKEKNPMEVNMVHEKLGKLYQTLSEIHQILGHKDKAAEYAAKRRDLEAGGKK